MRPSKKEEYAKRFEELTKQEIKNYNDSLLNTHKSLEEFRGKLKDSVDLYANQVAKLSSKINKVEAENRVLKTITESLDKRIERQIHDLNELEKKTILSAMERELFEKWVRSEFGLQYNANNNLKEKVSESIFMTEKRAEENCSKVEHFYRSSQADNIKLKEEILSLPSEAKQVKEELIAKADISAIDNEGILKELSTIKKKSAIQESLNEYFHLQLGRVKEKLSP